MREILIMKYRFIKIILCSLLLFQMQNIKISATTDFIFSVELASLMIQQMENEVRKNINLQALNELSFSEDALNLGDEKMQAKSWVKQSWVNDIPKIHDIKIEHSKPSIRLANHRFMNVGQDLEYPLCWEGKSDDPNLRTPEFSKFTLIDFGGKFDVDQPVFYVTIEHLDSILMERVKINGTVKKMNTDSVIKTITLEDFVIRPNSFFDVTFELENELIKSGNYDLLLTIESDEEVWNWQESFTIQPEEAKRINQYVDLPPADNWLSRILVGVGFLCLLMFPSLYYLVKRKKAETVVEDVIINY